MTHTHSHTHTHHHQLLFLPSTKQAGVTRQSGSARTLRASRAAHHGWAARGKFCVLRTPKTKSVMSLGRPFAPSARRGTRVSLAERRRSIKIVCPSRGVDGTDGGRRHACRKFGKRPLALFAFIQRVLPLLEQGRAVGAGTPTRHGSSHVGALSPTQWRCACETLHSTHALRHSRSPWHSTARTADRPKAYLTALHQSGQQA